MIDTYIYIAYTKTVIIFPPKKDAWYGFGVSICYKKN